MLALSATTRIPLDERESDEQAGDQLGVDGGISWSRTVYELHSGGLYANSMAVDDDTIITVHDNRKGSRKLCVLRWRVPSRREVARVRDGGKNGPQPWTERNGEVAQPLMMSPPRRRNLPDAAFAWRKTLPALDRPGKVNHQSSVHPGKCQ